MGSGRLEQSGGSRLFGTGRKIFRNRLRSGTYYRVEGVDGAENAVVRLLPLKCDEETVRSVVGFVSTAFQRGRFLVQRLPLRFGLSAEAEDDCWRRPSRLQECLRV